MPQYFHTANFIRWLFAASEFSSKSIQGRLLYGIHGFIVFFGQNIARGGYIKAEKMLKKNTGVQQVDKKSHPL